MLLYTIAALSPVGRRSRPCPVRALPPSLALFEGDIVEHAATRQDQFHCLRLGWCGRQLVCVGFADTLSFHIVPVRLSSVNLVHESTFIAYAGKLASITMPDGGDPLKGVDRLTLKRVRLEHGYVEVGV